ncbi:MAG: sugar transferase [Planctomycetes bacterium]|nr:sugar transferase [Planctomycetota bacterium]
MKDVKRLMDVAGAASLLAAFAPLLGIIAAIVRATSPGPVFFRQTRVGLRGRPFTMLKFRSMRDGADREGPWATAAGDLRITSVGRLLRRSSLDELPQLINVLRGDMSLIGPRPDVPEQRSLYTEAEWECRHRVRPGVTGWAQATLRHEATLETRKALDLEYVRRCSLRLDLKILWLTLRHLLKVSG